MRQNHEKVKVSFRQCGGLQTLCRSDSLTGISTESTTDWNSTEWTAVKFCTDIHVLTRIKSLTFPQVFLAKFLNIY